jgi:hypothetical protein
LRLITSRRSSAAGDDGSDEPRTRAPVKAAARAGLGLGAAIVLAVELVEVLLRIVLVPAVEIHRRAAGGAQSPDFFEYDAGLGWRGWAGARDVEWTR